MIKHTAFAINLNMIIKLNIIILLSIISTSTMAAWHPETPDETACKQIEGQIGFQTGHTKIGEITDVRKLINGKENRFAIINKPITITSRKHTYCSHKVWKKKMWEECKGKGTGSYSWWVSNDLYQPLILERNFSKDRKFKYTSTARGEGVILSLSTDKYYKADQVPKHLKGYYTPINDVYIPMCDSIKLYTHEMPKISKVRLSGGNVIKVKVKASIDSFSKNAIESTGKPSITYSFKGLNNKELTNITTTNKSINHMPQYNDEYRVTATVNDGKYNKKINLGTVIFSGSSDCPVRKCGHIN